MTIKFKVPPLENSPGFIIHQLDLLLKLGVQKAFQSAGINITVEQWAILSCLWEKEGLHQSAIGERLGKDRPTITRMLNLLDKNGYIRRVPTNEDKRRLNVYLTDSGRELKVKIVPVVLGFLEKAFTGLSREEATEFVRMLRHITGNLEYLKGVTSLDHDKRWET